MASCSQDKTVKLWWYDSKMPLFYDESEPALDGMSPLLQSVSGQELDNLEATSEAKILEIMSQSTT
jgi:hypothetical protein